ncbi:carboxylesterase/lipase family protein [Actinomadura rudentiformis]|uniref:carboxylesterase/lipase family protein n=1 Tax=Actinomadura rudentiformis TaxID=359158 RepID=UPI001CEFA555|nr:carboxylesterase family protein [Actinomadura rudentiformis]
MTGAEARITTGRIRGRAHDGITVFKGVPYAAEPFGRNRLAAPVPAASWDGTREAVAFGPRAPQAAMVPGFPGWTPAEGLDCLTVNVWTPDHGGSGLPVMVWVHGGAYLVGTSSQPEYDGATLAAEGVVVVTFNYRVGMEGFGWVEGAPANRGLLDQIAALRWVQDNIAVFGGDPGRVTVFGESAGAGSIAALLAMPAARGLFRRAIAQSVPGTYFAPEFAHRLSTAITAEVGCGPTVADLADVSPEVLVAAAEAMTAKLQDDHPTWGPIASTPTPYSPVVDGEVLPTTPWRALADGAGRDLELIVGFNRDEFRLFLALAGRFGTLGDGHVTKIMKHLAPPGGAAAYRAAHRHTPAEDLYSLVLSDWLFRMPSAHLADAHAAAGGKTFAYELAWPSPGLKGMLRACHALDVPLTFGTLDKGVAELVIGEPVPDEAVELSAQFRAAWTAFATTGDPGWPAYNPAGAITHVFDTFTKDVRDPQALSRRVWAAHRFDPLE